MFAEQLIGGGHIVDMKRCREIYLIEGCYSKSDICPVSRSEFCLSHTPACDDL